MFTRISFPRKLVLLLVAALMVISSLGLAAQPAQAATCTLYHTVQRGEYLSMIARQYNADWQTLAELNNLTNPSRIYPGQKLCVSTSTAVIPNTGTSSGNQSLVVVGAVEDTSVTAYASNFPASTRLDVYLTRAGATSFDEAFIERINSDRDGNFEFTINIPQRLRDVSKIDIRLETQDGKTFATATFTNETFKTNRPGDVRPKLDASTAKVRAIAVDFGEVVDLYNETSGFFTPKANFSADLVITRYLLNDSARQAGLNFNQDLVEVRLNGNSDESNVEKIFGLNYLYFNLSKEDRKAYDAGKLGVYQYNADKETWEACKIQVLVKSKNKPAGRLACIINKPGLYTIGSK